MRDETVLPGTSNVTDLAEKRAEKKKREAGYSENALAALFVDLHAGDLRFVNGWGRWMQWDGARWKPEATLLAFDYARAICEEKAAFCRSTKKADAICSAKTVAAVERIARATRKLAATTEQWDRDPMTLACPAATINLATGNRYPPMREDYGRRSVRLILTPK